MSTASSKGAICYGRFSTTEQSKGLSLERQRNQAAEFAEARGWVVEQFIFDEGRSAFHGDNRQDGAALYQFENEARQGLHNGKALVVENIDRLSRQGAKAAARLVWELNELGIDVATYHDGHVYKAGAASDPMDLFKLIIIAEQAREESVKKSLRTKASWEKRFERMGEGTQQNPIPHAPLWFDRVEGKLVRNDHRVAVLNEIYDLYLDGVGIHRIVTMLNERGEPDWSAQAKKRTQGGWFYSTIHRLLNKRSVLGEYVKSDGTVVALDFYEQVVSAEKFNRVQAALKMRKSNAKPAADRQHSILTGLAFCSECGGGAHFDLRVGRKQTYTRTNGEVRTYEVKTKRLLRCDRARRKLDCTNPVKLDYDVVEGTILDEMLPRLITRPESDRAVKALQEQIAEAARQQGATQAKLDNLIDAIAEGGSKALAQRIGKLEALHEHQQGEIDVLRAKLSAETAKPKAYDDAVLIEALRMEMENSDPERRRIVRNRVNMGLRRLIHRIDIEENDTFRIWLDENTWFQFDAQGVMLEGEAVLTH